MWLAAHRRRAAWSPDGLFAVVPAGLYQSSAASAPYYVSHVIARRNPTKSFALLPSGRKPSIAVKFCPTLFKLSSHGGKETVGEGVPTPEKLFATPLKGSQAAQDTQSGFNMPYKMIFAVATTNSILVYDTEQVSWNPLSPFSLPLYFPPTRCPSSCSLSSPRLCSLCSCYAARVTRGGAL
jgi:chromatin assembly factor 1 subunit B